MSSKILLIIAATILTSSLTYYLFYLNAIPPKQAIPIETPSLPAEGPLTERGSITCIPKLGTGPQTMECALGLLTGEGTYYGLRHLADYDEQYALVSPDVVVEVSGTLVHEEMYGPDGNRYDTVGIIEIETITEL